MDTRKKVLYIYFYIKLKRVNETKKEQNKLNDKIEKSTSKAKIDKETKEKESLSDIFYIKIESKQKLIVENFIKSQINEK
jgi:hypothetical protein